MSTRRWYSMALVFIVVIISAGAAFSISSLSGWHIWGPLAKRQPVAVVAKKPAVARVAPAAPGAMQPQQQATPMAPTPDAVAVLSRPAKKPATPKWTPSDRQRLNDAVYLAGKENRPSDAIAALEAWNAKHPGDPAVVRELARLLARSSRSADALYRYRELLTIAPDTATRAEYAAALLALQQYDSAAANYRILIAADGASTSAHLGLARALAWANRSREAGPELHWLVARMPNDTLLVAMLHVARGAYDPSSTEAARWVS